MADLKSDNLQHHENITYSTKLRKPVTYSWSQKLDKIFGSYHNDLNEVIKALKSEPRIRTANDLHLYPMRDLNTMNDLKIRNV